VIPTSLLRKVELPTKSQLQVGSLSTTFPTPLSSCVFPCGSEADLHKHSHSSPQPWSSRAMTSHLEGFTSKSNKCYKDCFTKLKCSSAQTLTQRILSMQTWISHKSHKPQNKVLERAHKVLEMSVFCGWHQHPPKEGGKSFNTYLLKTSHWELASKN
jgi:hypothetical protein